MQRLRAFANANRPTLAVLAAMAVLVVGLSFVGSSGGCQAKVAVPARIQEQMKVDAELPLKTARTLFADFKARSEANVKADAQDLERLSGSIAEAEAWEANMRAILWSGIDAGLGQAQAIPGLGAVLPLLTGLVGLFLPRPRERKAVDAAYDQGRTETLHTLTIAKGLSGDPSKVA